MRYMDALVWQESADKVKAVDVCYGSVFVDNMQNLRLLDARLQETLDALQVIWGRKPSK